MGGLTLNLIDISGANIAFTRRNLTRLSKMEIFQTIGFPELEKLIRLDGRETACGMPKQLMKTADWDKHSLMVMSPLTLAQPKGLEAPETIFTDNFDYRVDLWRVGCTV
jgi:hypothetical protein